MMLSIQPVDWESIVVEFQFKDFID
jgi:hypothetical protein